MSETAFFRCFCRFLMLFAVLISFPIVTCRAADYNWKVGWISGVNTPDATTPNWGVLGTENSTNVPPTREGALLVRDPNPNFSHLYMYGGLGAGEGDPYPITQPNSFMSDTWRYDYITNLWTWVNGPTSSSSLGLYGADLEFNSTFHPRPRGYSASCVSANPNNRRFYVYGGSTFEGDSEVYFSDFWMFDLTTWQWARIHEYDAETSVSGGPGQRQGASMVHIYHNGIDRLYLFGGSCRDSLSTSFGLCSDLWIYDMASSYWERRIAAAINSSSVFSPQNLQRPGGRQFMSMTSLHDRIYVFGGRGWFGSHLVEAMNDLWVYTVNATTSWNAIKFSADYMETGVNTTIGVPNAISLPAGRVLSQFVYVPSLDDDTGGAKFLMVGGRDAYSQIFGDMWLFDTITKIWIRIKGSFTPYSGALMFGVDQGFGALGDLSSSNAMTPRYSTSIVVIQPSEFSVNATVFAYGGHGYAKSDNESLTPQTLQDMWSFTSGSFCDALISIDGDIFGQCRCKSLYMGFACEQCIPNAAGWPNCHVCDTVSCGVNMGLNGMGGHACNETAPSRCGECYPLQYSALGDNYCHDCNCDTTHTVNASVQCLPANGRCDCIPGYGTLRCSERALDYTWKYGWVSGVVSPSSAAANWGVLGVEAPTNVAPNRKDHMFVTDPDPAYPYMYMFGGFGAGEGEFYPASESDYSFMGDLWRYNKQNNQWTWLSGSKNCAEEPRWGLDGQFDADFTPGGRTEFASCASVDPSNRRLYVFGGYGFQNAKYADFWMFDMALLQWARIKIWDSYANAFDGGPGMRVGASMVHIFTSTINRLYLVMGVCKIYTDVQPAGPREGFCDDIWYYDLNATANPLNSWTLFRQGTAIDARTSFPPSMPAAPGARYFFSIAAAGTDIYYFGGTGWDMIYDKGYPDITAHNDLWKYNVITDVWTFLRGDPFDYITGRNITRGVADALSFPTGRERASLVFLPTAATAPNSSVENVPARLLLFGGVYYDYISYYNDIWIYDSSSNWWVWIKGEAQGINGTIRAKNYVLDMGYLSPLLVPTARHSSPVVVTRNMSSTTGSDTALYFYGGKGYYIYPGLSTYVRPLMDLYAMSLDAPCRCDPAISTGKCDLFGQCYCTNSNYTGVGCDKCAAPGAIGWPNCHVCPLNRCPFMTGYNGVGGSFCNETSTVALCAPCASNQYNPGDDGLCRDCACNTVGTIGNSVSCNLIGDCACAAGFEGTKCELCKPGRIGPFCVPISSSSSPLLSSSSGPLSSSAPYSSSSDACRGTGGSDIRARQLQLYFNYTTIADISVPATVAAVRNVLAHFASQFQVSGGAVELVGGTRVSFTCIIRGDDDNCLSALNLTVKFFNYYETERAAFLIDFPRVDAATGPGVQAICSEGARTYFVNPTEACPGPETPESPSESIAGVVAAFVIGGLFVLFCVILLIWNLVKGRREGVFPIKRLIDRARGSRHSGKKTHHQHIATELSITTGSGVNLHNANSGLLSSNITDINSSASFVDRHVPPDQEFLDRFPFIRSVETMNEYFNYLHNLNDRQRSLEIAAKYLSPMSFDTPDSNFYLFRQDDNLQRWVFPFLFKNHSSLVMSISHSAEQNLLDSAMVLIVEVHFKQFLGQFGPNMPTETPVTTEELTESQSASRTLGLATTLFWLKTSHEWEWGEEASTFARLILYTFVSKLESSWIARDQRGWSARDLDGMGYKHLFPSLHTVETFIFCSPLKRQSSGESETTSTERDVGLHIDNTGFLDTYIAEKTVVMLAGLVPIIQRLMTDPPQKEHALILAKVQTELEFFTAVTTYFKDAMLYVDEPDNAPHDRLETVEKRLLGSSENLRRLLTERTHHKKHEYTKREVLIIFKDNIETIRRERNVIKTRGKLKAIHDYAAGHLTTKAADGSVKKGSTELKNGSPGNKPRTTSGATISPLSGSSLGASTDSTGGGDVAIHIRKPGLGAIAEHGRNTPPGSGVKDNLNDRELAELRPFLTEKNLIGFGVFGSVYKAIFRGCDVAVKVIRPENAKGKAAEAFEKEIEMHLHLRSPRLLLPIRVWHKAPDLIMVTEIMARGNLRDVLRAAEADDEKEGISKLSNSLRLQMAVQISQGLMFLHRNDPPVVHRDIKPENVLVDEHYNVKLSDFGLSSTLSHLTMDNAATAVGSALYMAPELFSSQLQRISPVMSSVAPSPMSPSKKETAADVAAATLAVLMRADVYSFGILMIELFGYAAPWNNFSMMQLVAAHKQGQARTVPVDLIEPVRLVVAKCIQPRAVDRPDIGDVLTQLSAIHL